MDTSLATPPKGAIVLFNGKDVKNWLKREDGTPAAWKVEDEILHVVPGEGDIYSKETFTDFFLHVEFRCPNMPKCTGQAKGNSGVYLQGRYEIQVLDSYGWKVPGQADCGAFYCQHAPTINASKKPMEWQTYDVVFRAPRVEGGTVVEQTRVTVIHNGIAIHNNVMLHGPTGGAMDDKVGEPGPLLLQDHSDLVCFRNIWAMPLPSTSSKEYGPSN